MTNRLEVRRRCCNHTHKQAQALSNDFVLESTAKTDLAIHKQPIHEQSLSNDLELTGERKEGKLLVCTLVSSVKPRVMTPQSSVKFPETGLKKGLKQWKTL